MWLMVCTTGVIAILSAQHSVDGYVPETDTLVQQKLTVWQDARFGLFMHWGIYSQWGVDASWSLCSEDMGWNPREKGRFNDYEQYKEDYRNLRKELKLYSEQLAARPHLVVANKMDLPEAADRLRDFKRRTRQKPLPISAEKGEGIDELKAALRKHVPVQET